MRRAILLFVSFIVIFHVTAQLNGKYCADKPPYVSACFVFSEGDRFEYYASGQNSYSSGKGIYSIVKDTLKLIFKTDSLIGNPLRVKNYICTDDEATIIIKSIDYETGETSFGSAWLTNQTDSVLGGDYIDMEGSCTLKVKRSDQPLKLHLASTGYRRYDMELIPNKNYDIYLEMRTASSHDLKDGDKMIFRICKIKKKSIIIGDFLQSIYHRKYKYWKQ